MMMRKLLLAAVAAVGVLAAVTAFAQPGPMPPDSQKGGTSGAMNGMAQMGNMRGMMGNMPRMHGMNRGRHGMGMMGAMRMRGMQTVQQPATNGLQQRIETLTDKIDALAKRLEQMEADLRSKQ